MTFNAKDFLIDNNIEWFPEGSKNTGKGYISIKCPFCDDHSNHGGFNLEKSYYNCHRCGPHWLPKVISKLTNTSFNEAKKIIKQYQTGEVYTTKKKIHHAENISLPIGIQPLTKKAKNYLINRNFDPDYLTYEWDIQSVGNLGYYKFSIVAPIYLNHQLISYQCRDTTGKWKEPYRGCPVQESIINLKHTLYGIDKAKEKRKCLVVEGIMDVFRMGPGSLGTFGIKFTTEQVLMLARNFDEIFIMYDPEEQAQEQADKLYWQLQGFGKEVEILDCPAEDPAELSDDDARIIMREIGLY